MGKQYLVYECQNIQNSKKYIGLTVDLDSRKAIHFCNSFTHKSDFVFHKALRKYGKASFRWRILVENLSFKEARVLEKKYIKLHNTQIPNGYNMTVGGDGIGGYKFTTAQREKLRLSHLGFRPTLATKRKMRLSHLGRKNSASHNANIAKVSSKTWRVVYKGINTEVTNLKQYAKSVGIPYGTLIYNSIRL